MVRTGIKAVVVAALSILANRFISTPMAIGVAFAGGLWLFVTYNPISLHLNSVSRRMLAVGGRRPVLSFTAVTLFGAILGAGLFGGAWIYSIRRFSLEATNQTESPKPSLSVQSEAESRRDIVEKLRQEYIASHDDISAGLLAGTEQPPVAWVNNRLTEMGERWKIELPSQPKAKTPKKQIEPAAPPTAQPLTALSDGQRFVLKQKLSRLSGKKIRIVLTSREAQSEIVYEQLLDIFKDSGWEVSSGRVGFVSVTGANLPDGTYISGRNLSDATLAEVYSIFLSVGFKVPITPNAYMGPGSMGEIPPVVIIVR